MYKDKEAQRMASKERMRRYRLKGVTSEGVTEQGVTLSDGQLWYPGNYGYHPRECLCNAHPDRSWMTGADYTEMITPKGL